MIESVQQDDLTEFDITEAQFDAMAAEGEQVEVTGPPDPAHRLHVELVRGDERTYGWRLVAASGEILAKSATSYVSADDVRRAVSALIAAVQRAPIIGTD